VKDWPLAPRYRLLRPGLTPYDDALRLQHRLADEVRGGEPPALVLLEHPPVYTLGVRGRGEHLLGGEARLRALGADVVRTDRGGDVTWHGPGQLVGYPIVDLRALGLGAADYVRRLEALLIDAVACFGIVAGRSPKNAGVWVGDAKLAAIGVRISRGVTTHGFAVNVSPDLRWYEHIVPCGLPNARVTSMQALTGERFLMADVEDEVARAFERAFGVALIAPDAGADRSGDLSLRETRSASPNDIAEEVAVGR
jgi:lipoate-protein ligase B